MTEAAGRWPAPAKLNLFLHVVGQRPDGYHDLQTLFQLVDFGDEVTIAPRVDGAIVRGTPLAGVPEDSDLTIRAARALASETAGAPGATVSVHKRIPMGAGLGGGSSNAATVLRVLNRLWGLGLSVDRLAQIGASLGADVPVFVHGASAWAAGVGERLWPAALGTRHYAVIWPGVSVDTGAIFAAPKLTRDTPPIKMPGETLDDAMRNDLQVVAAARYPQIQMALDWLSGFAPAAMTGSGSAVFARFATRAEASAVAARAPNDWQAFACTGVGRSPLNRALDDLDGAGV